MNFISALFKKPDQSKLINALRENAYIVDVRTPAEFSAGSVQGAVNIPLAKVRDQISKFKKKKHIVLFCRSGHRSGMAKSILEQNGFHNVINGKTRRRVNNALTKSKEEP